MPRAWRATASTRPGLDGAAPAVSSRKSAMDRSLEVAAEEGLVFGRVRVAATQLRRKALLGQPVAELSLDPQRKPQRFRGRLGHELVVAADELLRLLVATAAVEEVGVRNQRLEVVRVEAHRPVEVLGRFGGVLLLHAAAGGGVGLGRSRVERAFQRVHEPLERLVLAPGLAQKPAVVVVEVGILRRELQPPLEARFGGGVVAQVHVHQPLHVVRRRIARIGGDSDAYLLERDPHVAELEIRRGEIGVRLRARPRVLDVAKNRPIAYVGRLNVFDPRGLRRAARHQTRGDRGEQPTSGKAHETALAARSPLRVRSCTRPASWPHAASMSSPRVRRVVQTMPTASNRSAKRRITSGGERRKPDSAKALKGIRLNLQGISATSSTRSRAWASLSLMLSSITYSNVMKSRGERSR